MRAVIPAFVGEVALISTAVQAAPLPAKIPPATPAIELVAQGCGWGWHRHHWRDRWGYWH
jgi:hypothetical protein